MKKNTLVEIISALLIILFVYTGVSKFLNYDNFVMTLDEVFHLDWLTRPIAIIVPILEILISFALLTSRHRQFGLYTSFVLLLTFTLYVGFILNFAGHVPCSCGGIIRQLSWKQHLIFNTLFTIISFLGARLNRRLATGNQSSYNIKLT
jgi:putative oxidoreductase